MLRLALRIPIRIAYGHLDNFLVSFGMCWYVIDFRTTLRWVFRSVKDITKEFFVSIAYGRAASSSERLETKKIAV